MGEVQRRWMRYRGGGGGTEEVGEVQRWRRWKRYAEGTNEVVKSRRITPSSERLSGGLVTCVHA